MLKFKLIFIFLASYLLQSCASFQATPVNLTENDVIHRQHTLLQQRTTSEYVPLHKEWERTWALEDKWEQNTHFWLNPPKTNKKIPISSTATVVRNQTKDLPEIKAVVPEKVPEKSSPEIKVIVPEKVPEPVSKPITVQTRILTPPQQEENLPEIKAVAFNENSTGHEQAWTLETLVNSTSQQDYQRCPIQPVYLPTEEPQEIPQSVADWQRQEIKKILLEFGEHKDFQVPDYFQKQVAKWITRFTHESSQARAWYVRALRQMDEYYPTINTIFSEKGLPPSLYYLALIESGFNPTARSHAGAVGLWQFIPSTARRYGLKIGTDFDQRTQPEQATIAAREYLHDLILEFGDGHSILLAMAAYNAGENGIRQRLRRLDNYRSRNFWTLAQEGLLPSETHDYVPKIFAAAIIGRNRAHFGFEGNPHHPVKLTAVNFRGG